MKKIKIYNSDGTVYEQNLDNTVDVDGKNRKKILILVLSIVLPFVVIALIVGFECWRRRRQAKNNENKELGTHSTHTEFPQVSTASNMM